MAAVEARPLLAASGSQGEAPRRDAVGRIEVGSEREFVAFPEIAEKGRLPVVDAEAAKELAVGGEASPALGDDGRAQEVGRLRREAQHDLMEEIVDIQRMHDFRRQRQGSAVAHVGLTPRSLLDWGIGEWREKCLSNPA
jgi:hypothetical protein